MNTFTLTPTPNRIAPEDASDGRLLSHTILANNAWWFVKLRWIVVAVMVAIGLGGWIFPHPLMRMGIIPPAGWPWTLAAVLLASNIVFFALCDRMDARSPARLVRLNIGLQIAVDLAILTVLVHFVGSTETFIAFTYLFHIVLACIFLPRSQSFLVLALAAILYCGCVLLEQTETIGHSSLFMTPPNRGFCSFLAFISTGSAVVLWLIVWHLVSSLAAVVRKRDWQLSEANEELVRAQETQIRQMLQTAHDLKTPFAGIDTNIQVLHAQHWNELSEPVREIIERIRIRSLCLSARIKDILILGDLRTRASQQIQEDRVDLPALIREVIADLEDKAAERGIRVDFKALPVILSSDPRQLSVLFSNLIANAILYSRPGGYVTITVTPEDRQVNVAVADCGIGIGAEHLPHIFDEYYRTKEAAQFNKQSTGLGLAIVRQVAHNLGLGIRVASEPEQGSTFVVTIPADPAGERQISGENRHGEDQDHRR